MAKVFRLHDGLHSAGNNIDGWGNSIVISDAAIESIKDPQDSNCKYEITSIPSPFARLDLVKQAFKYINDNNSIEGNSIYHRMVSDCFDVGEIFFNIDNYKDKIAVHSWNIREVQNLKDSNNHEEKLLGETLDLYIDSDKKNGDIYNLGSIQDIFILEYIGEGSPSVSALGRHIIGATSPCTMFFTPSGDLSYVSNQILFEGNDRPFDGDFCPLYKRDKEYVKYIVWLSMQPNFAKMYPEVADYVQKTVTLCNSKDHAFGQELRAITAEATLSIESVKMNNGQVVTLAGGFDVMKKVINLSAIQQVSQFVIRTTKDIEGALPLVLPVDKSCQGLIYTASEWDATIEVPVFEDTEVSNRLLPGTGVPYPYLTLGDFLEKDIIKTNMSFKSSISDSEHDYFMLGTENGLDEYLLPVKKEYFKYFSLSDLKQHIKAKIGNHGEVVVTLRIPIVGNGRIQEISYERIYNTTEPTNVNKFGATQEIFDTGITILPHVRFNTNEDYRITLFLSPRITGQHVQADYPSLAPYRISDSEVSAVDVNSTICRNMMEGECIDRDTNISNTYVVSNPFDIIEVTFNGTRNLIIPELRRLAGPKKFRFAVDFGTTNTHIEYSVDANKVFHGLDVNEDAQIRPTAEMPSDAKISKIWEGDIMPVRIGANSDVSFPIRTALTYRKGTNWNSVVTPLGDSNIPFYYEKKSLPSYNEDPITNLKWNTDNRSQHQLKCFIANLAYIMRNKVLMNGGSVEDTEIVWFYPTSMPLLMVGDLTNIWNEIYAEYFRGNQTNIKCVPEAVAPLPYYRQATSSALTIDIGGGTCDFLFAQDQNVECISSARFASNSVFGDGLNNVSLSNGLIKHFTEEYLVELGELPELKAILEKIKDSSNASANLASYFFSLKNNHSIKDDHQRQSLDFTRKINNSEEARTIILLFYLSLVYYSARLTKAKGLKEPRHIGFSGNGSKVLDIFLKNAVTKAKLVEVTQVIFEKVLGRKYDSDGLDILDVKGNSPKEATSQGGLELLCANRCSDYGVFFVENHSAIWLGTSDDELVSKEGKNKYEHIEETDYNNIKDTIKNFANTCKTALQEIQAEKYLNIVDTDQLFESDIFIKDITKYVKDGRKNDGGKNSDEISSTLFFYPIEGVLHKLGTVLFK